MTTKGEMIKEARERLGITQAALGQRVGCSDPLVCLWEAGARGPGPKLLPLVASELGLSRAQLAAAPVGPPRPARPAGRHKPGAPVLTLADAAQANLVRAWLADRDAIRLVCEWLSTPVHVRKNLLDLVIKAVDFAHVRQQKREPEATAVDAVDAL